MTRPPEETISSNSGGLRAIVAYSEGGKAIGPGQGPDPDRLREPREGPSDRRDQLGQVGRQDQRELVARRKERL